MSLIEDNRDETAVVNEQNSSLLSLWRTEVFIYSILFIIYCELFVFELMYKLA